MKSSRFWGRGRAAGLSLGLALALVGCQELIVGKKAAPGEVDYLDDLYAVSGIGDSHVWTAGYFGAIVHTEDGGQTWKKQESGSQRSIYDISFADEKNGWAVGRRGFIIHTADGGQTWERQKSPRFPPRHLFSVEAIDAQHAWAVGDWGSRYYTQDGGKTWEDHSFLVDSEHPTFKYLSEEEIEAYGRGEKVYDDIYLNDVFFLDEQRGWIAGEYGILYYTENGGQSWEKGQITGTLSFAPVPFAEGRGDVAKEDWDYLFDVGAKLVDKPYLRVRVEGFLTEAELKAKGDTTVSDDRALAVSDFLEGEGVSQDRIRQQNPTPFDQGDVDMEKFTASKLSEKPIAVINILETPFLFDVKFTDEQNGLVGGLGGVILQSSDGGKNWTYRESDAAQGLYAVSSKGSTAWAVGEKGLHRRSHDGGKTWERLERGEAFQDRFKFYGFMRDMEFPTQERGWIVGQGGLVLRSSDGGGSWEQIHLIEEHREFAAAGE